MSMRIAHVTATFPPYRGGTGNVCYHNARELARRGHEVHVFTAAVPGAPARELRDGFVAHRLRPLLRAGNAPVLPSLLWRLRGFDIVHLHCPFIIGAEFAALATMLHHIPLVVTYHNDLIHDGSWRDIVFRLATWTGRHAVLEKARRLIFVSQGHAETNDQRDVYRQRQQISRIVPNSIDIHIFKPQCGHTYARTALKLPPDGRMIGFVGGLDSAHHYKGLSTLIHTLTNPLLENIHLLVIGDGNLKSKYCQETSVLGISERVHFHGAVANEELPLFYQACDILVMPSLVAESFGLVLIEALACGIPVIASDGPGVRSVVQHGRTGLLVKPGDQHDLAAALQALLSDPIRCQEMGRAGRIDIEANYSNERVGEQLESIYYEMLQSPESRTHMYARGGQ